jgi:hypothetical protein
MRDEKELEAWDKLLEAFRTEFPSTPPPPWLESRIMAEINALPEPGWLRRLVSWLTAPRPVRVSPLLAGAALGALVLAFWLAGGYRRGPSPGAPPTVYVQFTLDAPGAQSVSVAGDFDAWEGSFALEDPDGDGTWTGRVPLPPGVHAYMFLVDGSTWKTDPQAQRYAEDGFGNRNAILAVAAPST